MGANILTVCLLFATSSLCHVFCIFKKKLKAGDGHARRSNNINNSKNNSAGVQSSRKSADANASAASMAGSKLTVKKTKKNGPLASISVEDEFKFAEIVDHEEEIKTNLDDNDEPNPLLDKNIQQKLMRKGDKNKKNLKNNANTKTETTQTLDDAEAIAGPANFPAIVPKSKHPSVYIPSKPAK